MVRLALCGLKLAPSRWAHLNELGREGFDETQQVTLTNDFYMSDHEVTQAEWQALIGNNPSGRNNGTCPTCPVERVNWWEALYYANSLSSLEELTPAMCLRAAVVHAGERLTAPVSRFRMAVAIR